MLARTDCLIPRAHLAEALTHLPLKNTVTVQHLFAPSGIYDLARDADDFHLLSKTLGAAGALPASAWINPAVLFARFPHARRNPPGRSYSSPLFFPSSSNRKALSAFTSSSLGLAQS